MKAFITLQNEVLHTDTDSRIHRFIKAEWVEKLSTEEKQRI